MAPAVYTYRARYRGDSPRSRQERLVLLLWEMAWTFCCLWTPKPFNRFRLFWLRAFGARIHPTAFVHQRARIAVPWNLTMEEKSCIGDRANIYSLSQIAIGARAVIAQESYICTGTHDFGDPNLPLSVSPVIIGADSFIGARAFVLPGVTIGSGAVVGACSVVSADVAEYTVVTGNPAREIRKRQIVTNFRAAPSTLEPDRFRPAIVLLSFALYLLIVLEGIAQKWIFPHASQMIPYCKDIVLLAIYLLSLGTINRQLTSKQSRFWLILSAVVFASFVLAETIHSHSSSVALLEGLRFYVFLPPLAWVIARHGSTQDFKRFVQVTLLLSLPAAILVFLQYNSPPDSPINALSDPRDMRFMLADKVRTTGTFVYTKAQAMFVGLLSACLVPLLLSRRQNYPLHWSWMIIAACSAFLCLCLNGNRTAFFLVFLVLVGVVSGIVCQSRLSHASAIKVVGSLALLAGGAIGTAFLFHLLFPGTEQALCLRQTSHDTVVRALTDFDAGIRWDVLESDPLGRGLSTHLSGTVATTADDNGASRESGFDHTYFVENEWGRIIDDTGVFGIVFLTVRTLLAAWLVVMSFAAARRSGSCLPTAFSFLVATLLVTQMIAFQETFAYLTWFLVGVCCVANRLVSSKPLVKH